MTGYKIAIEPPADIRTYATRIPATWIRNGRTILDDAGINWRAIKVDRRSADRGRRETPSTNEEAPAA